MPISSIEISEGIQIEVYPEYIPKNESPDRDAYYFAYTVVISNIGSEWAKLISRHWIIIDSNGNQQEVVGEGVVGYSPELKPGDSFTYTSYCPLDTPWGTMEGSYQMLREDGTMFEAIIGRFYLVADTENDTPDD